MASTSIDFSAECAKISAAITSLIEALYDHDASQRVGVVGDPWPRVGPLRDELRRLLLGPRFGRPRKGLLQLDWGAELTLARDALAALAELRFLADVRALDLGGRRPAMAYLMGEVIPALQAAERALTACGVSSKATDADEGDFKPYCWFQSVTKRKLKASTLRAAAAPERKTKRVRKSRRDGAVVYSVADAKEVWPHMFIDD